MEIRKYQSGDFEAIERICQATSNTLAKQGTEGIECLLTAYCHYYLEQEPENCYVAVDGEKVVGYILGCQDYKMMKDVFLKEYVAKASSEKVKKYLLSSIQIYDYVANKYPAHLHIDLDPAYQHQGLGTKLMDALLEHFKEQKVAGVAFGCAGNNEKGLNFYRKYGFKEAFGDENGVLFTMDFN